MKSSFFALTLCVATFACAEDGGTPTGPVAAVPKPPETALRRLTRAQYESIVHAVFGDDIAITGQLEPDVPSEDFELPSVFVAEDTVSVRGVGQYEDAAYAIAAQVMETAERRARLVPCTPAGAVDEACAREALAGIGRRLWRRPLTDDELGRGPRLDGFAPERGPVGAAVLAAQTLGDFHDGLEYGIAALLMSPPFLYREEIGQGDPAAPGERVYDGFEMASRLSFFFWDTGPDDALLDAAERGALDAPDGLSAEVARLSDDPRAHDGLRRFVEGWLGLYALDDLVKDPTVFVHAGPTVGPSAREETLRTAEWLVFERGGDFLDLFTTRTTFLDRKLASIYSVRAPAREGFGMIEYPADSPRAGVLGHISVLALNSHPVSSSATLRGKFVRMALLCDTIPTPPVNLNTAIPEPSTTARTLRERLDVHLSNDFCATCHLRMDLIGLGLEQFDGLGRYRTTDHEARIDPHGAIDDESFADAVALGELLRDHPRTERCVMRQLYRHATGRRDGVWDEATIDELVAGFSAGGHDIRALMRAIATSDAFRRARPPVEGEES